ncbi:MAG: formylglycine-generating enzyme family protein [Bacteroidales bacterium]|nr:formylglycine-generating enzyme family protein [Bacteroidales bacterium]
MRFRIICLLSAVVLAASCKEEADNSLPTVETLPVTTATSSTAVLRGSTKGGTANMLCRGVCFSSSELFSFTDSPCVSVDAGEGEFSVRTYELIPMHKYYMKAFAVMKDGTVIYGNQMTFSTTDFQLPTVGISPATDIYATEATLSGSVVDSGDYPVTSTGFIYTSATSGELVIGGDGVLSVHAVNSAEGFSATIGELEIGTAYRVRAYAMTENGAGYSDEITFSTLDIHPVEFAEIQILENTYSSLVVKSAIEDRQGNTVTSFGFCWSSSIKLPTIKNSSFASCDETFTLSMEDVTPGKIFYLRAYAETEETGVNYGNVTKVKVVTYDCDGGMIKIIPSNPVFIGWLGDYEQPSMPAKYSQAHDGEFQINQSVGRSSTPVPSEATLAPFCMAKYEVTNRWFCEFLNNYGSTVVKDGTWKNEALLFDAYTDIRQVDGIWTVDEDYLDCPVVGVTFYGADAFCRFFGGYLPNEAQWEVAARGNVYSDDPEVPMFRFSGSDDLDDIAVWANGVARPHCEPVGQHQPNQIGIYDMSGNAQEMTSSWWGAYYATYKEAPMNANKQIVLRGGRAQRGVQSVFQNCSRDAYAITSTVAYSNYIGFRFACDPESED